MIESNNRTNWWLLPFSWLYGIIVEFRNLLFDAEILKSETYPIPIINVGNITVGGTGKTPHVEYLIRLLSDHYKVAVLSRGYKRKSKGYLLANLSSTIQEIGDEPWQMKQKFPHIHVAVDANRRRGIQRLMEDEITKDVEVILLDDAFQHRYVKPGMNILLTDFHRMFTEDKLLPAGRLREHSEAKRRANMVIVSKCPQGMKPIEYRVLQRRLDLMPFQKLFFSALRYGYLRGLYNGQILDLDSLKEQEQNILLVSGIGNPQQLEHDLQRYTNRITSLSFPDHHYFSQKDIKKISATFKQLPEPKLIVTTEKDATRLLEMKGLSLQIEENLYVLPIEVEILKGNATTFNSQIEDYVQKNIRNSSLD